MADEPLIDQLIGLLEEQQALGVEFVELSAESVSFLRESAPVVAVPATATATAVSPRQEVPAPTSPPPRPSAPPRQESVRHEPPRESRPPPPTWEPPDRPSRSTPQRAEVPPSEPVPAAKGASPDLSRLDLAALRALVLPCTRCPLHGGRKMAVFGEGNPRAELMFIGEGPGFDEDATGRPFVGKAGEKLNDIIFAMQFTREEVYIANIVKCRATDDRGKDRAPDPAESAACLPYLERQIELVQPKVIVTLGRTPLQALLGGRSITHEHGRWLAWRGIPVMPTFHPSYILRYERMKALVWADLKQVMARFGKDPTQSRKRRPEA